MSFANPEALRDAVFENDVLSVRTRDIRDAFGYQRIGVHVKSEISRKLNGLGIATWPTEIPWDQEQTIRLFHMGTPVADLINAALNPGQSGDDELRAAVSGGATDLLNRIKALVCQ